MSNYQQALNLYREETSERVNRVGNGGTNINVETEAAQNEHEKSN